MAKRTPVRELEFMLREWYGYDASPGAVVKHLPQALPLADVIRSALGRGISRECLFLADIQGSWSEIAGPENARRCTPVFFKDGILSVEVAHPLYLMAVNTPAIRQKILSEIARVTGRSICTELHFTAAGRARRDR